MKSQRLSASNGPLAIDELIATITTIAKEAYRVLGSGYLEGVYQNAIMVGLRLRKIPYECQRKEPVLYQGHFVGEIIPDLIVGSSPNRIIIELKVPQTSPNSETQALQLARQQLKRYMQVFKIDHGLLINFFKIDDATLAIDDDRPDNISIDPFSKFTCRQCNKTFIVSESKCPRCK